MSWWGYWTIGWDDHVLMKFESGGVLFVISICLVHRPLVVVRCLDFGFGGAA